MERDYIQTLSLGSILKKEVANESNKGIKKQSTYYYISKFVRMVSLYVKKIIRQKKKLLDNKLENKKQRRGNSKMDKWRGCVAGKHQKSCCSYTSEIAL